MKRYLLPLPLLFLINPFLSLTYSLLIFIKKRTDISLFFSLSCALILVYLPIMYDTSNHFYYTYYNKLIDIKNFDLDFFLNLYITVPIILGKTFNIDFYYFFYMYIFISLYLWSKIIFKAKENLKSNKHFLLPLALLLLSFNYRDLMDLNRNFLSLSILFYYIFCTKKRTVLFVIFFYLSISIHFTSVAIWIIYFTSKSKLLKKDFYIILLPICIITGFFLPALMNAAQNIINLIPGELGARLYYYTYGSDFGIREQSFGPVLKKSLSYIIIIIFSLHSISLLKYNPQDKFLKFALLLSCISLLFFQYITFFERLNLSLTFLYSYIIITSSNKKTLFNIIFISLLLFRTTLLYILIYFPIFLGNHNIVIPNSNFLIETEIKPFYYPTILLLDFSNGYSDENLKSQSIWGR